MNVSERVHVGAEVLHSAEQSCSLFALFDFLNLKTCSTHTLLLWRTVNTEDLQVVTKTFIKQFHSDNIVPYFVCSLQENVQAIVKKKKNGGTVQFQFSFPYIKIA